MMPPMPPRPNSPVVAQPPPSGRGRACERGRGEATLPTVMLRHGMLIVALAATAGAGLVVDDEVFGRSLGGWKADKKRAAEYMISGSKYRTYKPEVTPTPEGGIFVSLRIDHRRGWMANPDTANLELSFKPDGTLESAQSSLGFQGRKITSEVIRGGTGAGAGLVGPGIDRAVKISTDLVADLSAKLLSEKIVEPGRVTFPAAIRHNFNLLFAAVRVEPAGESAPPPAGTEPHPVNPPAPPPPADTKPKPGPPLEIKKAGETK